MSPIYIKALCLAALLAVSACSQLPQLSGGSDRISGRAVAGEPVVSAAAQRDYGQILELLDADDYPGATRELERFIAKHADFPGAYTTLAIVYTEQARDAEAVEAVSIALTIDPDFAPALNQLGVIKRKDGDFAGAEQAWQEAITADPDYAYAWHNLGVLYDLYLADLPAALQHYERYQVLAAEDSKRTERWIADLQRRIDTQPRAARIEEAGS